MAHHPYNSHREQQVAHRRVGTILNGSPSGAAKHAKGHAFSKLTSKSAAVRDDDISGKKASKRYARGGHVKHSDEAEDRKLIKKMLSEHEKKEGEGYARGGKVKGKGHQTNIAIVMPKGGAPGGPGVPDGPMPPPPMAGPGGPPMAGGPPGMPPGMPMRKHGGRVKHRADGGSAGAMDADTSANRGNLPPPVAMPTPKGPWGNKNYDPGMSKVGSDRDAQGRVYKSRGGSIDGESTKADIKKWGKHAKENSYFRGGAATGVGREEKAEHMKRKGK